MKWIGLTGSIGSGKSAVAELLRRHGVGVVDADAFARQVVGPGSRGEKSVLSTFGPEVADAAGHIDRAKLARIVFSDRGKLAQLEAIVHPLVQKETKTARADLAQAGHAFAFYDVPLLFEKNLESQFDGVVVVFADLEICVQRVMARSGSSRADVEMRVRNQLAIEEKIKRSHWVVHNNGSREELDREVDRLLHDIGRKFGKSG